ncbi:hypothetical protein CS022_02630 [Veronia nyctiphanis]|uniref:Uncharacterized protein n=1 Tax=Veronia nyctiphanis TaxID=1278244 RepID=A0A4Q0YUM1_9GAMM|nr:hypothetical protein [Veronia nyctiphanis]RXJ74495.1 hypothetical protein CS022_02630 [Veronia nyctiphanis]
MFTSRQFKNALFAVFLSLLVGVGFLLPDLGIWLNRSDQKKLEEYCVLGEVPCRFGNITIALDAEFLTPSTSSLITVTSQSALIKPTLMLRGDEMQMGVYKTELTEKESGVFTAEIILPMCTEDSMTWLGSISDKSQGMSFPISIRMQQ